MMNCAQVRESLSGLLYGDLSAEQAGAVEKHLAGCRACQEELAGLRKVRQLLDSAAVPTVPVDLARVYAEAGRRQERRLRRWRPTAVAALAVAAGFLVVLSLRLEVRIQPHQFVLRWGAPEPMMPPPAPVPEVREVVPPEPIAAADMEMLRKLIHALAENADARDREQQDSFRDLQEEIRALQGRLERQWTTTQRFLAALSSDQFDSSER